MTQPRATNRRWQWPAWLALAMILIGGLSLRLIDVRHQGETWDEIAYYDAAHGFAHNLSHLDLRADDWTANLEHPPIAKYLYALVSVAAFRHQEPNFVPGRVASAGLGMLTVWLVFLIGRRLGSSPDEPDHNDRAGLSAALILALLPNFLAFNIVLGLDTPTAFTFTLTIWLALQALRYRRWPWWLATAAMAGVAIGTRLSNLLILPTLLAIWLIWRWPLKRNGWSELVGLLALFVVVPAAVFFGSWPWLWASNWQNHLQQTLGHWSPVQTTFLGHFGVAPASYYLVYLFATVPAVILVALGWFGWRLGSLIVSIKMRSLDRDRGKLQPFLTIAVWFLLPFVFSFYGLRQGGFRYLLAVLPAVAIAGGLVLDELLSQLRGNTQRVVVGLLTVYLLAQCLTIRPYYLDYYNEFTGGPAVVAAHRWFQLGWWNEGVDTAVLWLNAHAEPNATVAWAAVPDRSKHKLRADLRVVDPASAGYLVTNREALLTTSTIDPAHFHSIHDETVRGVVLASVLKRN